MPTVVPKNKLRENLPPLPLRMQKLPIDNRGFPIPWFVPFIDSEPCFTAIHPSSVVDAWNRQTCWICGELLGVYKVFVIGPMCALTGISSEPPSHLECAIFAAKSCPFLTNPKAHYQKAGVGSKPDDVIADPNLIMRNPAVCILWITRSPGLDVTTSGTYFHIGQAVSATFWHSGRRATLEELQHSYRTGVTIVEETARREGLRQLHAIQVRDRATWPILTMLFNTQPAAEG